MTTFTEDRKPGDFLLTGDRRAIDYGRLAASQTVLPGTVLAERQIVAQLSVTALSDPENTIDSGTLALASPAASPAAKDGAYTVFCIDPGAGGGTFDVQDPGGKSIGTARVGVAFDGAIKFTIAAGAEDFIVGDNFTVTVGTSDDSVELLALDPAATDGSQIAAALAFGAASTGVGETRRIMVVSRAADVNAGMIGWPVDISEAAQADAVQALGARGIRVR